MEKWRFWIGATVMLFEVVAGYGEPQNGQQIGKTKQAKGQQIIQTESQFQSQRTKGRSKTMRLGSTQDTALWRIGVYLEQLWGEERGDDGEMLEADQMQRAVAYEHFEQLLEHPLPINRASRRELEELFILSDFQIASLLTYRQEHGAILSPTELSLLNGFNEKTVALLNYFMDFDPVTTAAKPSGDFFRDCRSELLLKTGMTLEQTQQGWLFPEVKGGAPVSPVYTYLRYGCDYLNRIQVGFLLENDAGERLLGPWRVPLSDFFSFHAAFKQLRVGKMRADVIVGDFSARFGQGLTLWKSFKINAVSSPSGLHKRGAPILPYTSSGEDNFLRGVAVFAGRDFAPGNFLGIESWEVAGVFSYNGVDARIEDGKYTSVIQGGLHRSDPELKNRKTMHETVAGIHSTLIFSRWKFGLSWTTYGYDKANGRRVAEYNKLQMYNGMGGNVGADFYTVMGWFRFFGEVALDYGGEVAGLLGGLFQSGGMEAGILFRSYGQGYIAPHSGAYSTTSSGCYNQLGGTINLRWSPGQVFALSGSFDVTHYPGFRYGISEPSSVLAGFVKGEYERGKWNGSVRISERFSTHKSSNKFSLKCAGGYQFLKCLRLGLKGEWVGVGENGDAVEKKERAGGNTLDTEVRQQGLSGGEIKQIVSGYVLAGELDYTDKRGIFRVRMGGSWFHAPHWNVRLYGYEAGLPGSYSSVLLYGTGGRGYVTAKVSLGRFCDLHGKMAVSGHKKRGGENELPAPRFQLQVGLKMKF